MRVPKRGELQACVAKEAGFGPRARRSGGSLCIVQGQAGPSAGEAQPHVYSLALPQHAEMAGGNSYFMGSSRNAGEGLEGPDFSLHPTCHKLTVAFQPALSMNPLGALRNHLPSHSGLTPVASVMGLWMVSEGLYELQPASPKPRAQELTPISF